MKNSKLNTFEVDVLSITEMKNKNGGCHDDTQIHHLLIELYQAIDEAEEIGIFGRLDKRFDELCTNEKL